MIAMTVLDCYASLLVNAERGAEHGRLHIMGDDGVAAEDDLDVASADQRGDVHARGGVDDSGTEHEQDFAAVGASLAHGVGHIVNGEDLGALGRYGALHEAEYLALAGALQRLDAHARVSHHHLVADARLVHRAGEHTSGRAVQPDRHIHLDILDKEPLAIYAHMSG